MRVVCLILIAACTPRVDDVVSGGECDPSMDEGFCVRGDTYHCDWEQDIWSPGPGLWCNVDCARNKTGPESYGICM